MVKFHATQEHAGVKLSYLEMSLDLSVTGVCSITLSIFVADILKDVRLGSTVNPASAQLFMFNKSSPLFVRECIVRSARGRQGS